MRVAFFHDHRFGRDASGVHYSNGALPYRAFRRYLRQFDEVIVVGRVQQVSERTRTIASGERVEMACVEQCSPAALWLGGVATRRVREVVARVDCAIIRLPSLIGSAACREVIRAKKPWMVEVVGCAFDSLWHHGSLQGRAMALPAYVLTRHFIERAPFALYVSQEFLQRRYPCRGESVGCSNVLIDMPQREVLERRLAKLDASGSSRQLTLGLVGSLDVDYKGHETAFRALALLKRSAPHVTLRLLGAGDQSPWRRRAAMLGIADRIEFSGTVPGGVPVLEWMDGLDLFVIPSLTEGLPRSLVEAMSRALPSIGSRVGGIPELLAPEWTHAPGDHDGLASRVTHLVHDMPAMKAQAVRNWEAALPFSAPVLEERRDRFLARFKANALRSAAGIPPRALYDSRTAG